jgi:hypothetical protein
MTASNFCPQCGTPRVGSLRYCASCQYDYWGAVAGQAPSTPPPPPPGAEQSAPPTATPAAEGTPARGFPWGATLVLVLVLAIVGLGAYALLRNQADQIMQNVADDLASINAGGGSVPGVPPKGDVWFGSSFDASTLAIRGRTTSVGAHEAFAVVAHLTRSMDGSKIVIRLYLDGQLLASNALGGAGSSDVWGMSPGPLFQPGVWKYEFTDIGGNVLASGQLTATDDS